jgi:hypothetical protein
VNACVNFLLASYHGGYLWLNRRIMIDPVLINHITGMIMQGLDPQDYYPRKTVDHALSKKIKEAYGNVEKGMRGYCWQPIQFFQLPYKLPTPFVS